MKAPKRYKTCLLVTDDPDDQVQFSEALNGISSDTILISVSDSRKALTLIKKDILRPTFIFFDLSLGQVKPGKFLSEIKKMKLQTVTLVVYGKRKDVENRGLGKGVIFLDRSYSYNELQDFLSDLLRS